tara:strand:+ start:15892 stop:17388 length:1497 start_codon:yes stop_codon:yes gene_type:complete
MSDLNIIKLHDRVKETSNSTGTGTVVLEGAVEGFAPFSDYVGQSGLVYYTITDSNNWEVGSGRFLDSGRNVGTFTNNQLIRFPLKSSNSNNLVDFPAGIKEVFVTHPAHAAIYAVAGLGSEFATPAKSGLTFWSSENSLNTDNNIVIDNTNTRIGINQSAPAYEIDLGGNAINSHIRASGLIVNSSGIIFSGVDSLRQTQPFQTNQTDSTTGSNAVIFYSGAVNQILTLQKQSANNILSGPTTGAAAYPSFRALVSSDIPDLSDVYMAKTSGVDNVSDIATVSGIAVSSSGFLREDISATSGTLRTDLTTASGALRNDVETVSGISVAGEVYGVPSGTIVVNDLITASGALFNDVQTVSGITSAGEIYGVASGTIVVNDIIDLNKDVNSASGAAAAQSFTPTVDVPATTKPLKYNYSGTPIATRNVVVSSSGFLTLPIFSNSSDLPPAISGFRGAMAICQFGTDDMALVFCAPISSGDGYSWYKPFGSGSNVGGYKPI